MTPYDPRNWFWQAEDGRVFASERVAAVPEDDAAFAAWRACGGVPTPWPRDAAGVQTDAALQEVLAPYGLRIVGFPPADAVTVVYRSDLYRRCSDDEAEKIDGALAPQPLRMRRLFESVQTFRSDDAAWAILRTAATELFGRKRADQLLAPSL